MSNQNETTFLRGNQENNVNAKKVRLYGVYKLTHAVIDSAFFMSSHLCKALEIKTASV